MGSIASCCWFLGEGPLSLTEKLIEKRLENVVGHDAGVGIGLAFAMKDGGGRLVNAVGLAKVVILINHGVEGAAFDERANLGHFRWGEYGSESVARGYAGVRVHGEREIAVDQVDLAVADVIIHQPAIGGCEEGLAGRALIIAKDLHGHGSVLRTEGLERIDVGESCR